jgi:hypothetical protein
MSRLSKTLLTLLLKVSKDSQSLLERRPLSLAVLTF